MLWQASPEAQRHTSPCEAGMPGTGRVSFRIDNYKLGRWRT